STDFSKAKEAILAMLSTDSRIVKQYIEDDQLERKQQILDSDKERLDELTASNGDKEEIKSLQRKIKEESDEVSGITIVGDNYTTPKPSLWKRLLMRNRKRRETVQQKIADSLKLNNVVLPKIDRSPFVGLNEMADSSINIIVRAWTPTNEYWGLYFDMNERFFNELPKRGFEFPFPQMDVHINPE
ncbi:MAG: mechanosensitive ion channel, partial [Muribaculaceae bacterium]|nr:mechanosensitive ion channel [Muribaculaceae bacterium]